MRDEVRNEVLKILGEMKRAAGNKPHPLDDTAIYLISIDAPPMVMARGLQQWLGVDWAWPNASQPRPGPNQPLP